MPGTTVITPFNIYVIAGYPDALAGDGHPFVSAPINSVNLYLYPTTGISVGSLIEGAGIPTSTNVSQVYPGYIVITHPTTAAINGVVTGGDTPVILDPPIDQNDPTQTCAGVPDLYERQFNFTNFSTNTPNSQQPGNKLDLEFNTIGDILNHIRCRLSQLQRDDGFLRTELLGVSGILGQISKATENALIVIDHVASNYDQFYSTSEANITNKLVLAEAAKVSAQNSATSAQLMSSQASLSAVGALTSKNQALVYLNECQAILADLLSPSGPISTAQTNATQAQQSAQSALQDKIATQDLYNEVEAWNDAIEALLVQATNAKNNSVSASLAAVAAASGASASAGQASNSAAAAFVSAAQAAGSKTAAQAAEAAALAHSLNYIPGPQGPQGLVGPPGQQGFQGPQGVAGSDGQQGIQGIQGIQGDPGPQGTAGQQWVYRGDYNGGITYAPNDYVTLNGSSYVMINFIGAGGYDPIGWPGSWQLIASKGDEGPQGPAGSDASMVGPQGPAGPAGQAVYSWRGNWDYSWMYNVNDVVVYDGSSYVATQSQAYNYPYEGSSLWQLIARRGDQGPQGNDGPTGPQGDSGSGGGIGYSDVTHWLTSSHASNQPTNFPGYGSSGYVLGWDGYGLAWVYNSGGGGGGGISDAPSDGNPYIRINNSWAQMSAYDQTGGGGSNGSDGAPGADGAQGPPGPQGYMSGYDVSMWMTGSYSGAQPSPAPSTGDNSLVLGWDGSNMAWRRMAQDFTSNSSGSTEASYYPYEIKVTVLGQDFWVPARMA